MHAFSNSDRQNSSHISDTGSWAFHNFLTLILLAITVVGIYQTSWNAEDYTTSIFYSGLIILLLGLVLVGLQVLLANRGVLESEDDHFLNVGLAVTLVGIVLILGSLFVVLFTI